MSDIKPKLWVKKLFDDGTELSPIISPKDVSDAQLVRQLEQNLRQLPGIDINAELQLSTLNQLGDVWKEHNSKIPWPKDQNRDLRFYYLNQSYSYFDAMTLAAMLKHLAPKKVLAFVDQIQYVCFLDILERLELNSTVCTFIEPDPDRLKKYSPLPADSRHKVICSNLRDIDMKYFNQLTSGDVLFVDTTHVAKAGSDVCRLFNRVLPALAPSVWVHIHDVFWPFEYPDGWLREGRSWNELYVLRAWLQFNPAYEIKLFLNYLWRFHEADCVRNFPDSKLNPGGALWIMRKEK